MQLVIGGDIHLNVPKWDEFGLIHPTLNIHPILNLRLIAAA